MKAITEQEVIEALKKRQGELTQVELADQIGISPQYLGDVLSGRRLPGPAVLQFLGLTKAYAKS